MLNCLAAGKVKREVLGASVAGEFKPSKTRQPCYNLWSVCKEFCRVSLTKWKGNGLGNVSNEGTRGMKYPVEDAGLTGTVTLWDVL